MIQRKDINDANEAAYLLANGCEIALVFVIPITEQKFAWSMTLSGDEIETLSTQYRKQEAVINLHAFLCAHDEVKKAIDAELAR
jgi:hypothetical protein